MEETIYQECIKRGIPIHNHESDLYIPVNTETKELVKFYKQNMASCFVNQIEGNLWYDIPFSYDPFWNNKP